MNERALAYLTLLEEEDPNRRLENLKNVLLDEPSVELVPSTDGEDTLHLPRIGYLRFREDCPEEERSFFEWIARQLERRQSEKRDELTGLISRSYWEREMKRTVEHKPWTIAMADIDHFKQFNDEHGHDMGDRVLEAVGTSIYGELGEESHCIRYGGEEVLILLNLDFRKAESRLDRYRDRLAGTQLFSEQPSTISMSMGIARHEPGADLDQSIKMADLALYESKKSGRNRLTKYAPYLDYSNRLYAWGIYRYLWSSSVRFSMDAKGLAFLLYWNGLLQWYDWNKNTSVNSYIPPECQQPIRSIRRGNDDFILLDAEGELWCHAPGDYFERITGENDPTMVRLSGRDQSIRAVGINNQLYRIGESGLNQESGLPAHWDQVVTNDQIYVVVENILIHWSDRGCLESWPLPEPARQVTASGESIYMIGESGRLFSFQPSIHQWEQAQFMNLVGSRVPCREVSPCGNRMVVLDEHGRLLLVRDDGSHTKSVPQEMNLKPPT